MRPGTRHSIQESHTGFPVFTLFSLSDRVFSPFSCGILSLKICTNYVGVVKIMVSLCGSSTPQLHLAGHLGESLWVDFYCDFSSLFGYYFPFFLNMSGNFLLNARHCDFTLLSVGYFCILTSIFTICFAIKLFNHF